MNRLKSIARRVLFQHERAIHAVMKQRLTFLERMALKDLSKLVLHMDRQDIPGAIVEAGCALGGSAIVLAAAKKPERPLYVYDVFGMIPPPSEKDDADVHERYETIASGKAVGHGEGDTYYGYVENLQQQVEENFARLGYPIGENNTKLIKGLFQDTMQKLDEPVALAHIDGDWYDSVYTCLTQLEPRLAVGGVLVIDDYEAWSGCRKAVDDYFETKKEGYRFDTKSRLHITKVKSSI